MVAKHLNHNQHVPLTGRLLDVPNLPYLFPCDRNPRVCMRAQGCV